MENESHPASPCWPFIGRIPPPYSLPDSAQSYFLPATTQERQEVGTEQP